MRFVLVSLCLLVSVIGNSQTTLFKKNTLSIGYGFPNIPALALSSEVDTKNASFGPLIAGYHRDVSKRITVGVEIAYSSAKTVPIIEPNLKYNYNVRFFTGLLRGDINYVTRPDLKIYSGLAMGLYSVTASAKVIEGNGTPTKYAETGTGFGWHLNACGAKWLITNGLGVYAELGLGYRGILNVGAFYNF